jgi:ABC-type phosphate/phosphonate transport system ATPase subunit
MTAGQPAYLSDRWTTNDYLSFSDFRPALLNIITTAQTPLTVGVFGPWGSGKTSLLRMLKREIDEQVDALIRKAEELRKEAKKSLKGAVARYDALLEKKQANRS